jgi:hypothetical protein
MSKCIELIGTNFSLSKKLQTQKDRKQKYRSQKNIGVSTWILIYSSKYKYLGMYIHLCVCVHTILWFIDLICIHQIYTYIYIYMLIHSDINIWHIYIYNIDRYHSSDQEEQHSNSNKGKLTAWILAPWFCCCLLVRMRHP